MKITKLYIAALFASLSLASCSDSGYWNEASQDGDVVAFQQSSVTATYSLGESTVTTVQLVRTNSSEAITLPVTVLENDGVNCPASIQFEAGSKVTTTSFDVTNGEAGKTYKAKVVFPNQYAGSTKMDTCNVSISIDYLWVSLGIGMYYDGMIQDNPVDVEIQKADGFKRWRVKQPYATTYEANSTFSFGVAAGSGPDWVVFYELANGSLALVPFNTGINYQGQANYPIWWYNPANFQGMNNDNCQWLDEGLAGFGPMFYIPGLGILFDGSSNTDVIQIALPD